MQLNAAAIGPQWIALVNMNAEEMIPQVIMMRAIHTRAPTRSRITLLGTSKMK